MQIKMYLDCTVRACRMRHSIHIIGGQYFHIDDVKSGEMRLTTVNATTCHRSLSDFENGRCRICGSTTRDGVRVRNG